jgi:hypothetical protein
MEAFDANINDQSQSLPGGKQRILMDGYQLPLELKYGLPYLRCRKPTDEELSVLPHIILTYDVVWDPSLFDNNNDIIQEFYEPVEEIPEHEYNFDQFGECQHRTVATHNVIPEEEFVDYDDLVDDQMENLHPESLSVLYDINLTNIAKLSLTLLYYARYLVGLQLKRFNKHLMLPLSMLVVEFLIH